MSFLPPTIYTASWFERSSAQSILQLQRNAARAALVEHKEPTESSNGGEGCRHRRAAQSDHRQGQPSAVVVPGGHPAVVPHPVSQVPVPVGHQGGEARDRPRRRAEGGADNPGSGHRQRNGGEATPAGRSGQLGPPAAPGVRGHPEAGAQAVRGDVAGPHAASLGQGRRGRRPPGHRQMPVVHAHRRRRIAPRFSPMLPRGLWHCSAVVLLAVPCNVSDDRSRRDHQAAHRSTRHVPDRHRPAHVRHGDVRHVLRLAARPGAHLREAEERGEDPVGDAGQVEVRPRRHPAAPGRRPREVQERAARHRPRHGLLRRGCARLLRRRLPAVQALGPSADTQQASLLRVNVSNVPAA